jgi:hypothetical protein
MSIGKFHADAYIDILDLDEELEKLEEASLEKLRGIKNTIQSLKLHFKKKPNSKQYNDYRTREQDVSFKRFYKDLLKEWPDSHTVGITDYVNEKFNKPVRDNAIDDFKSIVKKNNLVMISKYYSDKVEEMLKKFHTYNHKEYMKETVICECGAQSYRCNLSRHKKSNLHLNNLKKLIFTSG